MNQHEYKTRLHELWEGFWSSEGEQAENFGSELALLFKSRQCLDAEDYYLWGLSIYCLNRNDALQASLSLFRKALQQDESYYLARLYSGHCLHDQGEYAEALSEYLKVDQNLLREDMPIWRWVKLLEQIGFCYKKLNINVEADKCFEQVVSAYRMVDKGELVPIQEAYECLSPDDPWFVALQSAEDHHFA